MNSNEQRGVTCAAKSAILLLPTSSISPKAYSSSMGENNCFASLLVIHPGVSWGSALIDAASSVLLLPSRRCVERPEGAPFSSSDFLQSHSLIWPHLMILESPAYSFRPCDESRGVPLDHSVLEPGADEATAWAQHALGAKNNLRDIDAAVVEAAFASRMAKFGESGEPPLPSPPEAARPPQKPPSRPAVPTSWPPCGPAWTSAAPGKRPSLRTGADAGASGGVLSRRRRLHRLSLPRCRIAGRPSSPPDCRHPRSSPDASVVLEGNH